MPDIDLAVVLADGDYLRRVGDDLVGDVPTPGTVGAVDAEGAVDAVAAALTAGPNVEIAYDDTAGTITVSATSIGGAGGHASFSYNSATTEPPIGNQLRLNNASQTAATRMWVSNSTTDGLDVSIGLAKILAGHQIYVQDRDNAAKWVKYAVTVDGVDDGSYYDFTVAYHSGPADVPTGTVEFQPIAPGAVGVPPGGTTGQVLAKSSATDYAVGWADAAPVRRTLNAQTGTTYTPVVGDENLMVTLSNASAITVTLPQNSAAAFPVGAEVDFLWLGAGQPTFAAGTGATVNGTPGLKLRAQYSAATAKKVSTNGWVVIGDVSA